MAMTSLELLGALAAIFIVASAAVIALLRMRTYRKRQERAAAGAR